MEGLERQELSVQAAHAHEVPVDAMVRDWTPFAEVSSANIGSVRGSQVEAEERELDRQRQWDQMVGTQLGLSPTAAEGAASRAAELRRQTLLRSQRLANRIEAELRRSAHAEESPRAPGEQPQVPPLPSVDGRDEGTRRPSTTEEETPARVPVTTAERRIQDGQPPRSTSLFSSWCCRGDDAIDEGSPASHLRVIQGVPPLL